MNWEISSLDDVSENNFNPWIVLVSLDHQAENFELKSPVITDTYGLCLFMSFKKFTKLDTIESNSSGLWLRERWITDTVTFLLM